MKSFTRKKCKLISSRMGKIGLAILMTVSCLSSSLVSNIQTASAASLKPEATVTVYKGLPVDLSETGLSDAHFYDMALDGNAAFCLDYELHANTGVSYARVETKTNSVYNSIYNFCLNDEELNTLLETTPGKWSLANQAAAQGIFWAYEEGISFTDYSGAGMSQTKSSAAKILSKVIAEVFPEINNAPSYFLNALAEDALNDSKSGKLYMYNSGRSGDQRLITKTPGSRYPTYDYDFLFETATASHTFENQVQITKTDADTNQTLQGAQFDFYRNGDKFATASTDANGIASATSEYTISRTATSDRYEYLITDAKSKYNLDSIEGLTKAEAQALAKADAKKKAEAAAKEAVNETKLEFYAIEVASRQKYWLNPLNTQTTTVTKTGSGSVNLGTLTNMRQKGRITLTKSDNETDNPLSQAVFKLYARSNIVHPDGKTGIIYSAGQEVATFPATDASGKTTLNNLYLGEYYVKEVSAPDLYILDTSAHNISLTDKGQNVEISVSTMTIANQHQTGKITLTKHDSETDKTVPGAVYTLYAKSKIYHPDGTGKELYNAGDKVADFPATSGNGTAVLEGLYLGEYTIKETKAPEGYLLSHEVYDVTLRYVGQDVTVSMASQKVTDTAVRGNVFFEKFDKNLYEGTDNAAIVDANQNGAQGDATREGALYGLYAAQDIVHKDTKTGVVTYNQIPGNIHEIILAKGTDLSVKNTRATEGSLIATARTDENGQIQFNHLYLGNYYIQEIEPSEGYLLDTTRYDVNIEYKGQTVAVVDTSKDVLEQVKKQGFEIFKLGHQAGTSGIGKPLSGVVFEIKLESDVQRMGWDKAPVYDRVTTNMGHAVTKDLPYGYYRVREVTPAPDYNTSIDFFVNITEDSRTPLNTVEANTNVIDEAYTSLLKVAKLDADSLKEIAIGGTEFRIKALEDVYVGDTLFKEGEYIGYWDRSLFPKYVDSWITNSDGYIYLQEKLGVGKYQLEEIHAPKPYALGIMVNGALINAPVEFTITNTGEHDKFENTNTDITYVTLKDTAVKGRLNIEKRGEVLVDFADGQFIYEEKGLPNAKFNVLADEDIMDPSGDGTILHKKGEVVATVTTNDEGFAQTDLLPLGKYRIEEVEAPFGMVLNGISQEVELTYEDETVPVVFDSATFTNERQKVKLDLTKYDLDDSHALAGAEMTLFANKDILNVYGEVIVTKGQAIQTALSHKNGEIIFDIDLPVSQAKQETDNDILDPDFSIGTDEDGYRVLGNEDALFFVKETKQPDGYISHYVKYMIDTAYEGQNRSHVTIVYDIYNEATQVDISKTDLTTGKDVIGAHLTWTDKETGEVVDSWITDGSEHRIKGSIVGRTYILTEIIPAEGYVTAESIEYTVQDTTDVQKVEMKDDHTKVEFTKTDIETGLRVAGAEFSIIPLKEDGTLDMESVFDNWITQADNPETEVDESVHFVERLPIGQYVLREKLGEEVKQLGYVTADDFVFEVKDTDKIQQVDLKEDFTHVTFTKVDVNGHFVPHATLQIVPIDKDGRLMMDSPLATWETEDKPYEIERIPIGYYALVEVKAPAGYVKAQPVLFEVKDTSDMQVIKMIDKQVEISKQDITTGKELPGAELIITDEYSGQVIDKWISGDKTHFVSGLEEGKTYILTEITAPKGYYVAESIEFTVTNDKVNQKVIMKDAPITKIETGDTTDASIYGAFIILALAGLVAQRKKREE